MKKVSVAKPTRWAVGVSLLCALSTVPIAHAQDDEEWVEEEYAGSWVLVKIQGNGSLTKKSKTTGGEFTGPDGQSWSLEAATVDGNGTMGFSKTARAEVPDPPLTYDGVTPGSEGGQATASVDGKFKVWLEWQGGGTPTKICYLRVQPYAGAGAGSMQKEGMSWSASADSGLNSKSGSGSFPLSGSYYDWVNGGVNSYDPDNPYA